MIKKLYELVAFDSFFKSVDKEKQKTVIRVPNLQARYVQKIMDDNGNVKIMTVTDKGYFTTEEKAGDFLREGEAIFIPRGGTFNIKYYDGKYVNCNNMVLHNIRPDLIDTKYLFYYLNYKENEIRKHFRGPRIKRLDLRAFVEMDIAFPSLESQRKILFKLDMIHQYIKNAKPLFGSKSNFVFRHYLKQFINEEA